MSNLSRTPCVVAKCVHVFRLCKWLRLRSSHDQITTQWCSWALLAVIRVVLPAVFRKLQEAFGWFPWLRDFPEESWIVFFRKLWATFGGLFFFNSLFDEGSSLPLLSRCCRKVLESVLKAYSRQKRQSVLILHIIEGERTDASEVLKVTLRITDLCAGVGGGGGRRKWASKTGTRFRVDKSAKDVLPPNNMVGCLFLEAFKILHFPTFPKLSGRNPRRN